MVLAFSRAVPNQANQPLDEGGGVISGADYALILGQRINWVLNNTPVLLTHGGGSTGNAIVVTSIPPITAYAAGQAFWLPIAAANTTAVTISIDGLAAIDLRDSFAVALTSGSLQLNSMSLILHDGTRFRVVSSGITAATGAVAPNIQTFTSSGSWTKPAGNYQFAFVFVLGGGGAGAADDTATDSALGGEGGSAVLAIIPFASLGSTETVTIGAGAGTTTTNTIGVDGAAGGDSLFGAFITCPGGRGGNTDNTATSVGRGLGLQPTLTGATPILTQRTTRMRGTEFVSNDPLTFTGVLSAEVNDSILAGAVGSGRPGNSVRDSQAQGWFDGLGGRLNDSQVLTGVNASGRGSGGGGTDSTSAVSAGTAGYVQVITV